MWRDASPGAGLRRQSTKKSTFALTRADPLHPLCVTGMLDLKGAHEWVVTTKLGSSDVRPGTTPV